MLGWGEKIQQALTQVYVDDGNCVCGGGGIYTTAGGGGSYSVPRLRDHSADRLTVWLGLRNRRPPAG